MRIIIDTDNGQDDAVALLLALGSPEIEVIGITTVGGNVGVEHTFRNARIIAELTGRTDIPVLKGCDAPLVIAPRTGAHVHGETGLGGHDFAAPSYPGTPGHAAVWLTERLMAEPPGSVTVVAIGPLTNLAMALRLNPDIAGRIARIVIMGGGFFEGGNSTPAAEFNVVYDPHAADIVFRAGIPLVVVPLDLTQRIVAEDADLAEFRARNRRLGGILTDCLTFYRAFDARRYGTTGAILHDPCAVAWLLCPEAFEGREVHCEIELNGRASFGMTVVDWWHRTGQPANCLWLRSADRAAIFHRLNRALETLDTVHS